MEASCLSLPLIPRILDSGRACSSKRANRASRSRDSSRRRMEGALATTDLALELELLRSKVGMLLFMAEVLRIATKLPFPGLLLTVD